MDDMMIWKFTLFKYIGLYSTVQIWFLFWKERRTVSICHTLELFGSISRSSHMSVVHVQRYKMPCFIAFHPTQLIPWTFFNHPSCQPGWIPTMQPLPKAEAYNTAKAIHTTAYFCLGSTNYSLHSIRIREIRKIEGKRGHMIHPNLNMITSKICYSIN
ncbi:Demethylrebeccamycin-D-glucose O-methyltransferase [Fusarium oxysporum f. sp. albedinis]|nr:Demethylrebeccamycin-D-glucose O-methyltransferase [Fusarium oxysporum f. sp. albedinis]